MFISEKDLEKITLFDGDELRPTIEGHEYVTAQFLYQVAEED
jgi:hypothetical protein